MTRLPKYCSVDITIGTKFLRESERVFIVTHRLSEKQGGWVEKYNRVVRSPQCTSIMHLARVPDDKTQEGYDRHIVMAHFGKKSSGGNPRASLLKGYFLTREEYANRQKKY